MLTELRCTCGFDVDMRNASRGHGAFPARHLDELGCPLAAPQVAHTPGPWRIAERAPQIIFWPETEEECDAAESAGHPVDVVILKAGGDLTPERDMANLKLAVRSPEMHALLLRMKAFWENGTAVHSGSDLANEALALLADMDWSCPKRA